MAARSKASEECLKLWSTQSRRIQASFRSTGKGVAVSAGKDVDMQAIGRKVDVNVGQQLILSKG